MILSKIPSSRDPESHLPPFYNKTVFSDTALCYILLILLFQSIQKAKTPLCLRDAYLDTERQQEAACSGRSPPRPPGCFWGFMVQGVQGLGFWGSGFRVQGLPKRV